MGMLNQTQSPTQEKRVDLRRKVSYKASSTESSTWQAVSIFEN